MELTDTENRLLVARRGRDGAEEGGGKMGEGNQKVQTSNYKMNTSWGCNVQHDDYIIL